MKYPVTFLFFFCTISLMAQHVGFNITNPEHTVDIRSWSNEEASQLNISNLDKSRYVRFFSGSDLFPDPSMSWSPGQNFLFATFDDATLDFTEFMRINANGEVGIGIPNPEAQLDLKGGDWDLDGGNPGDLRIGNATHNLRIGVATGGGGAGISRIYSSSYLILGSGNDERIRIDNDGETGFGTTDPDQKVHINGKLRIGDDGKSPTEGTIRFNSSNSSFEGYDGTQWINLGGGSSPYGVQGTFNLPNSSFYISVEGNIVLMRAVTDKILLVSTENVQIGFDSSIPPNPIYGTARYVNLFEKNDAGDWDNTLSLSETGSIVNFTYALNATISQNRILISDSGNQEVHEYSYNSALDMWVNSNTFTSPEPGIADKFGSSLGIYGEETIIGAPASASFGGPAAGPGKAYIYDALDNLDATLTGPGATTGDNFGSSVDISLNRAIVGASGKAFGSISDAGFVVIYNKFAGNWSQNSQYYDDTPETDEGYGGSVRLEDSDYFYVRENDGYDAYLIEDGFWTLKETISSPDTDYTIGSARFYGNNKMAYINNPTDDDKIEFITTLERDANNIFVLTSNLINGDSEIDGYAIVDNAIYTCNYDGRVFIFNY
ncbi:MAG: hypothetical protein AAGA77_12185 [Bacteroidota bacterium]